MGLFSEIYQTTTTTTTERERNVYFEAHVRGLLNASKGRSTH